MQKPLSRDRRTFWLYCIQYDVGNVTASSRMLVSQHRGLYLIQ